jgi:hypothetical protein
VQELVTLTLLVQELVQLSLQGQMSVLVAMSC